MRIRRRLRVAWPPILSSLRRMVPQVAWANRVWARPIRAERAEQDIGQRGEPEAQRVGAHGGGRGAVGEQVELAFLDPVSPSCRGRSRSPRRDMGPQLRTA